MPEHAVPEPVRTCVGCRVKAPVSELIRVVARPAADDAPGSVLVVGRGASFPGRGAHLHPTADCLQAAVRRKAFVRALRLTGPVDTGPVHDLLRAAQGSDLSVRPGEEGSMDS